MLSNLPTSDNRYYRHAQLSIGRTMAANSYHIWYVAETNLGALLLPFGRRWREAPDEGASECEVAPPAGRPKLVSAPGRLVDNLACL